MQLHELQSPKRKTKKRIGRGGKRGTYSGRGIKGQKARAGAKIRPQLRDVIKKIPKKRGYRMGRRPVDTAEVTLAALERTMKEGETVTPDILAKKGIVQKRGGKMPRVKILNSGSLSKGLTIKGCYISAGAKAAVEQQGGTVTPVA